MCASLHLEVDEGSVNLKMTSLEKLSAGFKQREGEWRTAWGGHTDTQGPVHPPKPRPSAGGMATGPDPPAGAWGLLLTHTGPRDHRKTF